MDWLFVLSSKGTFLQQFALCMQASHMCHMESKLNMNLEENYPLGRATRMEVKLAVESDYVVPSAGKDALPSASEGARLLGFSFV